MGRKLEAAGVDFSAPIVCIHPGAAWRPRAWRPERFAAVADWIQDHYHPQVLFVGSSEERDIEAAVRASAKGRPTFWLAGALTWQEVTALLERARLFLGNEGGPAHVAAANRVPSVVLSGPQEPGRFNPWSDRSVVLHHRVHCCPCRQRVCVHPENPCVNLIEIEEVKAQVRRILGPPESFR
jgi:ADP-heptose:LPS heptosyltransferase